MTDTSTMFDSTDPAAIPGQFAALYRNGRFAATPGQAARFFYVLWIDVLANDPAGANILDVEAGDATPSDVRPWCEARQTLHPFSVDRLYCNLSTWPAVKGEVAQLSESGRARVRYWIANPTGAAHLVPGSDATQYLWGQFWDESAYGPGWVELR